MPKHEMIVSTDVDDVSILVLPFLKKAMEISECVYSIHMADTVDFVREFCEAEGRSVVSSKIYKYEIPHTFSFHTKTKKTVDVAVVNIR